MYHRRFRSLPPQSATHHRGLPIADLYLASRLYDWYEKFIAVAGGEQVGEHGALPPHSRQKQISIRALEQAQCHSYYNCGLVSLDWNQG